MEAVEGETLNVGRCLTRISEGALANNKLFRTVLHTNDFELVICHIERR